MKTQIKNLIKLAEDFREFSEKKYGWMTKRYFNSKIRCYFSADHKHTSVQIDWVVIYFYDDVTKIEFTNPKNITPEKIETLIKKYSIKLKKY